MLLWALMMAQKFNKNNIDLYRDEGLAVFKNINGHQADKIRKEFQQLFKKFALSLEVEYNLKIVNYLDVTLNLNNGTYYFIANLMTKLCISTPNQTLLLLLSNNFLYQPNLDILIYQAISTFSVK